MNKDEMIKEAYTLMVRNNPDEAIKCLIRLDKELYDKTRILEKIKDYIEELEEFKETKVIYRLIKGDSDEV